MADQRGRVVGVLLAAGLGTRFEDGNKLLADVAPREAEADGEEVQSEADGGDAEWDAEAGAEPVVRLAARNLTDAPVDDAVAVLGHDSARVRDALDGVGIETVENPDYESGQASSVARGVEWARDRDADAALFALGDMPWVEATTYRRIVDRWQESNASIVVPEYEGERGNPVLFGAPYFDELAAVSGDVGGRELLTSNPVERVLVDDPGTHRDVDTAADLDDGPYAW